MKQCFGYVRVSTVKQGEGVSLDAQRDAIAEYADRRNIQIVKWYEETVTAAKKGRPHFNQMLSELRRKRVDGVIFHKIDRSTRNHTDWARIIELHDKGVMIKFAADDIDLDTRSGRLMADMLLVLAADYVRNLRDESIKGQKGRLKQGVYPYSAPIGYLNTGAGKPKAVDPIKAPLVRELFKKYSTSCYSYEKLAALMSSKGLMNTKGTPLSKLSVERILKNPFYTGCIQIHRSGDVYSGIHKPIISSNLFDLATAVRKGRRRKVKVVHNYRYRGIFQCKPCNRALIGERQKGRVYYRCHSKACSTSFREDVLDQLVCQHLNAFELEANEIAQLREPMLEWIDRQLKSSAPSRSVLEISNIEKRLSQLTDKMLDGLVEEETYKAKQAELIKARTKWRSMKQDIRKRSWYETKLDELLERTKSLIFQFRNADNAHCQNVLRFAGSNFFAHAKSIDIEPPNWLSDIKEMGSVLRCGHDRTPNRTLAELTSLLEVIGEEE